VNRAQQTYRQALTVDPNFYLALTNLARLYAEHGGPLDEALRLAQKAKAAQPDDPNVNDALGWIYYKDGLYRSSIPLLEAAVAKGPQVGKFQFHLGMAYLASGQATQARNALQAALKLGLNGDDIRFAQEALQKAGS
jgi:Tfp pilus assembly protein PilF